LYQTIGQIISIVNSLQPVDLNRSKSAKVEESEGFEYLKSGGIALLPGDRYLSPFFVPACGCLLSSFLAVFRMPADADWGIQDQTRQLRRANPGWVEIRERKDRHVNAIEHMDLHCRMIGFIHKQNPGNKLNSVGSKS
jgi:hypothetical protein